MKLPYIFSSNSIFQADSLVTVSGEDVSGAKISVSITDKADKIFAESSAEADANGRFEVTVKTPPASFDEYTVTVAGSQTKVLERVLFGEVWLASGQSNMELSNACIPEKDLMFTQIKPKNIRFFHVDYQGLCDPEMKSPFPEAPQQFGVGYWISADDSERLSWCSAIATGFADGIYDWLNRSANVPVGILDASWGGTPITAWLDRSDIDADEKFAARMRETGKYPDTENWNKAVGCCNFQQTTAQYNVKIAPLTGVKARGVIWYQGEHETASDYIVKFYAECLKFYQRTYAEKFACDKTCFPMISSLIHYWIYGPEGECNIGYLNEAFINTALEAPDKFMYVSNADLQPVWGQHIMNHPIHPAHKYPLAKRFANMAISNVYGGDGAKAPATLEAVEKCGGTLKLRFRDAQPGLRIGDGSYYAPGRTDGFRPVHSLYVSGENHKYLPAEARIIAPDTLEVRCDYIDNPEYVAYSVQSMEPGADLYCGDYPVTQFRNDNVQWLNIQAKPWYDMNNISTWADLIKDEMKADLFFHPVWYALPSSECCRDTAFRFETDASLRICADDSDFIPEKPIFGAYVRSYPYQSINFEGFKALRLNLFNGADFDAELALVDGKTETVCPLEKVSDIGGGWTIMQADISSVPAKNFSKMIFRFTADAPKEFYRFVNIERIRLVQ